MTEEPRKDLLYLVGHVAWRLVQAAAATAAMIGVMMLVMPGGGDTKEKAYLASMKSDLRNLVTAEEAYFADHGTYAGLDQMAGSYFRPSTGVSIVMQPVTASGWAATAAHGGTNFRCAIFVGVVPPPRAIQGAPVCWKP